MNLYYKTVYQRRDVISEAILNFFLSLSSGPRLLLEVFIRRSMGQRYFSFSTAILLLIVLGWLPFIFTYGFYMFSPYGRYYHSNDVSLLGVIGKHFTWYLYLAGFLIMSLKRADEIKREPGVFDFARFSKSSGYIHPRFLTFRIAGKLANIRTIETLLEPAFFFLIGLGLWLFGQHIGVVLIVCSIVYSLSYQAAYHQGDHFVMDKIDEMICSEELVKSFVEGRDPSQTRGFNFLGHRPANPDARRRVAEMFLEDEDIVEAR